jgi:hypothetical protein
MRREIENEDPGVIGEFVVFICFGYRSLPSPVSKIIGDLTLAECGATWSAIYEFDQNL